MKKLIGIFLLSLTILTACSYTEDTVTKEPTEKTQLQSEEEAQKTEEMMTVEGIMLIGQTMEIDHLKHIEYDEYEIGVYDKNGVLMWFHFYGGEYDRVTVKKKDDIKKAYIERLENVPKREGTKYLKPQYIIYVPANQKIAAGTATRVYHVGKTTRTEKIRTNMIYSAS